MELPTQGIAAIAGLTGGLSAFSQVPIEIRVSVGCAHPVVRDLLKLRRNAVLPLDRRIEDPVELFVGERLIARGELLEPEDQPGGLAVRLTEVIDPQEGV